MGWTRRLAEYRMGHRRRRHEGAATQRDGRRGVAVRVVTVLLAIVAFGALPPGGFAQPTPPQRKDAPRVPFAYCIKPAVGAVVNGRRAVATLQRAFRIAWSHSAWPARWPKTEMPVIEFDCPHQPLALQPGVTVFRGTQSSSRHIPSERVVQEAGRFETIFVVLPVPEIERLFWSANPEGAALGDHRRESEEMVCRLDACTVTTSGRYLSTVEAADSELLARLLLARFGDARPSPTIQSIHEVALGVPLDDVLAEPEPEPEPPSVWRGVGMVGGLAAAGVLPIAAVSFWLRRRRLPTHNGAVGRDADR